MRLALQLALALGVLATGCSKGPAEADLWAPVEVSKEALGPDGGRIITCGKPGQMRCPTQAWMKEHMARPAALNDAQGLVQGFLYIQKHAPEGMPAWPAYAHSGAVLANSGNMDGAKQQCKRCHDDYRERYRAEMRDRQF